MDFTPKMMIAPAIVSAAGAIAHSLASEKAPPIQYPVVGAVLVSSVGPVVYDAVCSSVNPDHTLGCLFGSLHILIFGMPIGAAAGTYLKTRDVLTSLVSGGLVFGSLVALDQLDKALRDQEDNQIDAQGQPVAGYMGGW